MFYSTIWWWNCVEWKCFLRNINKIRAMEHSAYTIQRIKRPKIKYHLMPYTVLYYGNNISLKPIRELKIQICMAKSVANNWCQTKAPPPILFLVTESNAIFFMASLPYHSDRLSDVWVFSCKHISSWRHSHRIFHLFSPLSLEYIFVFIPFSGFFLLWPLCVVVLHVHKMRNDVRVYPSYCVPDFVLDFSSFFRLFYQLTLLYDSFRNVYHAEKCLNQE